MESTAIAELLPVAATFDFRDQDGNSLSDVARLETMVTVVDAINLLRDFVCHHFLTDRGESLAEDDTRGLVNLLTEQIEFADVVVLNKTSDADVDRTDAVRSGKWAVRWQSLISLSNGADGPVRGCDRSNGQVA